jgi:hypothetical protein
MKTFKTISILYILVFALPFLKAATGPIETLDQESMKTPVETGQDVVQPVPQEQQEEQLRMQKEEDSFDEFGENNFNKNLDPDEYEEY